TPRDKFCYLHGADQSNLRRINSSFIVNPSFILAFRYRRSRPTICWAVQARCWQATTLPQQRPPSLRRPPAWPLLRSIRLNDEFATTIGWQRNTSQVNGSGDQRLNIRMRQLPSSFHRDEAGLLSRSQQKPLRVWQLRSLI